MGSTLSCVFRLLGLLLKGRSHRIRGVLRSRDLRTLNVTLRPGVRLSVANEYGELKVLAGGAALIEGIFVDEVEAASIAAQWRHKARQTNVTEKFDAKRLVNLLLKLRQTANDVICQQVVKIDADILALDEQIAHAEAEPSCIVNAYWTTGLRKEWCVRMRGKRMIERETSPSSSLAHGRKGSVESVPVIESPSTAVRSSCGRGFLQALYRIRPENREVREVSTWIPGWTSADFHPGESSWIFNLGSRGFAEFSRHNSGTKKRRVLQLAVFTVINWWR